MGALSDFVASGVFAFILMFVRVGTAVMIMPGLGDSFVPQRLRLLIAVGLSLSLFPMLLPRLPETMPPTFVFFSMIVMEFIVGIFFGTVARIFMTALDTAGMVVSLSSSLSNAQIFNPSLASQGSLVGAFFSITGVMFLFSLNLHHLLIAGLMDSYDFFPIGTIPDVGSMAEIIGRSVSTAFNVGVKIALPFLVLTLMVYTGMGVLARVMPQIQVFILALPIQILLATILLSLVLSSIFLYWAEQFATAMQFFIGEL